MFPVSSCHVACLACFWNPWMFSEYFAIKNTSVAIYSTLGHFWLYIDWTKRDNICTILTPERAGVHLNDIYVRRMNLHQKKLQCRSAARAPSDVLKTKLFQLWL